MTFVGTLFQSLSEAQAAATTVFRFIDEVNLSYFSSVILHFVLFLSTIQAENTSINEADIWKEDETSNGRSNPGINGDIEFDAVNFTYPSREDVSVLRNLTLVARKGQTTALVGSSGCGQSLL